MNAKKYINPHKIITATILEPHKNSGESWDTSQSRNWQLVLMVGYTEEGYPIKEIIEKQSLNDISNILINIEKHIKLINID